MRILYLTEESISFSGSLVRGGAIHVRNVVSGLRERGHDIHLLDWNGHPERAYQHSVAPRSRQIEGAVRTFIQAISVGRQVDPEVIISKTRKTYLPGLLAARVLAVPHVVQVGSLLSGGKGLSGFVESTSLRIRLGAPHDGWFVVCDHIGGELQSIGVDPSRIYDIKNAVDTDAFLANPNAELPVEAAEAFDERPDAFRVGYVGGLHPYKGVLDLAAALGHVDVDVHVVVAGDGPYRRRLERQLGERGTVLGPIPYNLMPAFYDEIDALVLPSHTEGLPRVILEALASGTPVVATKVGGVPEVVTDGETGILRDVGNVDGLADAITRLAEDADLRESLARNGQRLVGEDFTWPAMYDRYEEYLGEIIKNGS